MTGLQASDLNKSKSKKKAEAAKQNPHPAPAQNQMGMHAGQMMQHLGYAAAGNQTMMAPMGFPSSMASALPHFQQIWSGQVYDQNQINQMQLMAAQAQQAQTTMMPSQQNGAAFFQQIQAAQQQQQQQTQVQPQQVQAAQVQQPQQDAAAVQIQQQVSPIYNGSPQVVRSDASPHLNSTSPLNVPAQQQPQQGQQQVVATGQEPQVQAPFEQQMNDSTASAATNPSTTWSWHDPSTQGQQFDMTAQGAPNAQDNGLIAAAAHQAFGESQQHQDVATRRMSSEISQPSVGTPQSSEGHKSGQPSPQGDAAQTPSTGDVNQTTQGQTTTAHLVAQQQMTQSPQTVVDGQSQPSSNPEQIVAPGQQLPTGHVVFNNFDNFSWGNFPTTQGDGSQARSQNGEGGNKIQSKETLLEAEVNHLRSALSEKTKEVQHRGQEVENLRQELEKAYQMIEQLKNAQMSAGTVGSAGGGAIWLMPSASDSVSVSTDVCSLRPVCLCRKRLTNVSQLDFAFQVHAVCFHYKTRAWPIHLVLNICWKYVKVCQAG